jgi:hypothetical protein
MARRIDGPSERDTQNRILIQCGRGDTRLFRQNVGQGWAGRLVSNDAGRVTLANARPLIAGLCTGSSDLIGWRSVVITPEMVGQAVAVFAAIEVKSATGRPTPEQTTFLQAVQAAGGIACLARSVEDAERALAGA